MPSIRPSVLWPPPLLDDSLDREFGFSAGIAPRPDGNGNEALDVAGDPMQGPTLQDACVALSEAAAVLRAPAAVRELGGLVRRIEDDTDHLSHQTCRDYLLREGAGLLHEMARLAADERIAPAFRRDQLTEAAHAVHFCLTGLASRWGDVVHRLSCAAGGVTQAAAQRRADMVRQVLVETARATLGRDPAERGRTLIEFESHYVAGLGRRLRLAEAVAQPADGFFDADSIDAAVVERARRTLRARVTPAAVVWSLAQEGLEALRQRLVEAGADPARLECLTPVQADVQESAIAAIERRLGPVDRWALFRQEDDASPVELLRDPTCLAVQGLLNLMDEGAVPKADIVPRLRLSRNGEPHRLCQLTDGLWWMQAGSDPRFDAGLSTPVSASELQALDRLPRLVLSMSECEGLARSAILGGAPEALRCLAPRWLTDAGLAAHWWRCQGSGRCRAWLDAQYLHALSSETRHALIRAADEAGDASAFSRLRPVGAGAAAQVWRACDGVNALIVAVRGGDDARLRRWLALLRTAAPTMSERERGQALTARDDSGRPALLQAMSRADGATAVCELTTAILTLHAAPLSLIPPVVELLAAGGRIGPAGIGTALADGRAETLRAFLQTVEAGLGARTGRSRQRLRDLVLGANAEQVANRLDGFRLAMAHNHAGAVEIWMDCLLRLRRRGVLSAEDFFDAAGVVRNNRAGVYHAAMNAGSAKVAAAYRGALRVARQERLLPSDLLADLLLGPADGTHAPSVAAAVGHVDTLREHLEAEVAVLGLTKGWTQGVVDILRWARRGGHTAIGAAMRHGQVEAVRVLTEHASRLLREGWKGVLFPSFQGRPGHDQALREAVTAGHLDAIDVWFDALTALVAEGTVRRSDMANLLSGRTRGAPGLFDAEMLWVRHTLRAHLLSRVVDAAQQGRWRSSHVLGLLGHGAKQPPVLVTALAQGYADALKEIGDWVLRLRDQGRLDGPHLRRLLSLKDARGRVGLAAVEARLLVGRSPDKDALRAYVALIRKAEMLGHLRRGDGERWTRRPQPG
ncbi:MAG: hypothetical protein EOP37_21280 [Rubrivivax sp.]|nr:MAG: hypothetical protein EOP37_21280 [Rubrivivax sp.]